MHPLRPSPITTPEPRPLSERPPQSPLNYNQPKQQQLPPPSPLNYSPPLEKPKTPPPVDKPPPKKPPEDPHRVSKNFFKICCANKCIAAVFIFFWKLSVRLYIAATSCCKREKVLARIKVPTFLTPEDREKCEHYLFMRDKPYTPPTKGGQT